jgi:hypothetical protein
VDTKVWISTHPPATGVVDEGPMFVDILAGARVASIDVEVDLTGPLQTIERTAPKPSLGPSLRRAYTSPLGSGGPWAFMATWADLALPPTCPGS